MYSFSLSAGSAFLSFSTRCPGSVNTLEFTEKFYHCLEINGCNPWMYAEDLQSGDVLSVTIFKTLDECKAVIPIVTKGFAQSIWCMREVYYATFKKSTQMHPVVIEDGWKKQEVGIWLENTLSQVSMHLNVNPTDERRMADIASKIGKVVNHSII